VNKKFGKLYHPRVKIAIIYGKLIKTLVHVYYKSDPRYTVAQGKFYPPGQLEEGIVEQTACAKLRGMKCAQDFLDRKSDAKPVHLVKLCGI